MEIFSDSFVIDFESIAKDPSVEQTAEQLRVEFQNDPAWFIDKYIELFTEYFRPVDLSIVNDPTKEEIFGQAKEQEIFDAREEEDILSIIHNKVLNLDDLSQVIQADERNHVFDLTLSKGDSVFENIERIDLTGNGATKLILDVEGVIELTGSNNTLIIIGDDGDEVVTKGDWFAQGMISIDGHNYVRYIYDLGDQVATLFIHSNITHQDGL